MMWARFSAWSSPRSVIRGVAVFGAVLLGVVATEPLLPSPYAPRIHVRWDARVTGEDRQRLEAEFGLLQPEYLEGTTWRYDFTDPRPAIVGALIAHPSVADTHEIDRARGVVVPEAPRGATWIRSRALRFWRVPSILEALATASALAVLLPVAWLVLTRQRWSRRACLLTSAGLLVVDVAWQATSSLGGPSVVARVAAAGLGVAGLRSVIAGIFPIPRLRRDGTGAAQGAGQPVRVQHWGPVALAAVAPILLIAAFVVGATPDVEEFPLGLLTSFLHVEGLTRGTLLSWTSALGFGIPQPMVPNFNLHPLAPLLALLSPFAWSRLLYAAHTIVGAIGMWQLCREIHLTPIIRAAAVFTFLLATPTQNYALTDFWPSHYVMWTSAPWLLLLTWRLLVSTGRDLVRAGVLLGLGAGLVLATTHPGHVPVYGTIVIGVAFTRWRSLRARWGTMLLAALIALAIASPNLLQLAAERPLFDQTLGIVKDTDPLAPSAAWDLFLRPFPVWERGAILDVSSGTRIPFFGGPFAVLSLFGLLFFGRKYPDLALGGALSTALLFTSFPPLTFVSRYHFRDPALLCAIPLAAIAVDALLRQRRGRLPATALLVAQCGIVLAAAMPFLLDMFGERSVRYAQGAMGATSSVNQLMSLMATPGRVAYAPQLDDEVVGPGLPREIGVNALAFRGLSLVNATFKGVSGDVLWPGGGRLYYGRIRLSRQLVESDEGLDMLGVRYVLAMPGEAVAPGLHVRGSVPIDPAAFRSGRMPNGFDGGLLLYENPDPWPGAFLVEGTPAALPELPVYRDCINDRLLCKDLTPLARLRAPARVSLSGRDGRFEITVDRSNGPRVLIVAEMYRPTWVATGEGGPLLTMSVGPGLLGVLLPAGTTAVRLVHRNALWTFATVLAWSVVGASVAVILLLARRARSLPARRV